MVPRLYLETTIPSYLAARRSRDLQLAADQEATQEWWEKRRSMFELFVSEIVVREVRRGDSTYAAARLELIRGLPVLLPNVAAQQLTARLLQDRIIPPNAIDDAAHLGLAAGHRMDFLLTWNCTHINNRYIQRRIESACAALNLVCPVICTPDELMNLNS